MSMIEQTEQEYYAQFADEWDFWQRALAGEKGAEMHVSWPHSGFWRRWVRDRENKKNKHPVAVAIWRVCGRFICCETVNGKSRNGDHDHAVEIWPWCVAEPITEEVYRSVVAGGDWPDQDSVVAAQMSGKTARQLQANRAADAEYVDDELSEQVAPGHNQPPEDPAELLKEQIESAAKGADAYAKIADDATLARAQSLRSRLMELANDAEKKHKKEKEPHLDAGRAVDRKWFPLRDAARAAALAIRKAMDTWETEKLRREREERQKAEDERLRLEAEARERDATLVAADAPPPAPEPAPPPPTQIRGAYGRAASVKQVIAIAEVLDWDEVYRAFKDHAEVRALLRKLADRAVSDGHAVPGVRTEQVRKVS